MGAGQPGEMALRELKHRRTGAVTSGDPASRLDNHRMREKLTTESEHKAMDTDAAKDDSKPKTRKVKKQVRKGELPISSGTTSLDTPSKNTATEKEAAMVMEDKLVADTEEKKNELETYIYELRNKLDDQYAELASDEEKAKIREKLEATEVS